MFFIYKVTEKRVRQFIVCPKSNYITDELVSGSTLKKLFEAGNVFEVRPELIIDKMFRFKDLIENISQSKYYTVGFINIELKN